MSGRAIVLFAATWASWFETVTLLDANYTGIAALLGSASLMLAWELGIELARLERERNDG